MVRPKLEYTCDAWDPHDKKDIKKNWKSPKKRRQILLAEQCSYCQCYGYVRHAWMELKTLEERRVEARLTLMYKIGHNLVDFNTDQYLKLHPESRTRGSHPLKYQIPKATKNVFKYSYFPRTIREWNKLPPELVLSSSIGKFRWFSIGRVHNKKIQIKVNYVA